MQHSFKKHLIFFALGFSLSFSVGVYYLGTSNNSSAVLVPENSKLDQKKMVEVLVAVSNIKVGESITTKNMAWREWPTAMLNDNFVIRDHSNDHILSMLDSVARHPISAGEPITLPKIIQPEKSSSL